MIECKTAKHGSTIRTAAVYEASEFCDAYKAEFCALVGPEDGQEISFATELQNHKVSAWSVDDLAAAIDAGINAYEMRTLLAPGIVADAISDFLWDRDHGESKRVRVVASYLLEAGAELQRKAALRNSVAEAPLLTEDVAMALVDDRLECDGCPEGCTRAQVHAAFELLTNPVIGLAILLREVVLDSAMIIHGGRLC